MRATTRLLAGAEAARAAHLINRKHPILQHIVVPMTHRLLRTKTLPYELSDVREPE